MLVVAVALAGCAKEPAAPVCGLHSAAEPVTLEGSKTEVALAVGARLMPGDRLDAEGYALLECFGGALKVLEDEKVEVGELKESKIQATTIPRFVIKDGKVVESTAMPMSMLPRYSDNRFTPKSALKAAGPSDADYFRAFFTPNGIENLGAGPRDEGPRVLPAPQDRPKVSRIHAGALGEGGALLEVEDEVVFAETDDLATAALQEGHTYALGRTVRLVLPDGAEATFKRDGLELELEGPMDLRLH